MSWWLVLLLLVPVFLLLCRIYTYFASGRFRMEGIRLDGRNIVITGPTSGIGLETARELGRAGANLWLLCRKLDHGEELAKETRKGGGSARVVHCDLSSLDSVRKAAAEVLSSCPTVHVLLCNAGMGGYGGKAPRLTEDGLELVMQSNYFGHFLLTRLLLPNIASAITSLLHVLLCNAGMGGYGGKAPRLTEDGLELVMQSNYFGHFLLTRLLLPSIASAITSLLHVLLCNAGMGGYGGKAPRLTEDGLELVMQSNYFGHFLLTRLLLPNIASAITSLLHVLLCNAGMGGYGGKAPRLTEDGLELVMQSNYFGHFLLTRLLLPNIASAITSLLHVLLCNAGMGGYGGKAPRLTEDGLELVMQSNYFGHFLLTRLLLPSIASAITSLLHVLLCNAGMGGYGGKAPRLTEDGLELVMQSNYFGHFLLTRLLLPNIASAITSLLHVLLCNAGMGGYGGKAPRLTEDGLELVMQSNYFGHFLLTRLLLPNIASAITSLLHVLLCNAGMGGYGGKAPRLTEDGLELVMQSNYFGHFLLTRLLLPNIASAITSLLHVLLCNAGMGGYGGKAPRLTEDGLELVMQSNYFGHFLLTRLLLPNIASAITSLLHVLLCNAGMGGYGGKAPRLTEDGLELVMQSNYFGHFLLTRLLLPNIASAITSLLHVLLCNAGMGGYGGKAPRLTEDGLELVMQSNYFGHFLLTRLLLPNIASAITSLLHVLLCNAGMGGYGGKAPRLTEDCLELVMQSNYFGHFLLTRLLLPNIASAITSLPHVLLCNAGMGGYGGKAPRLTEDGLELVMQSNYFGHFLLTRLLLPNIASAITSLLHVLLCNAGMGGYGGKAPRLTEDGLELVMQSNYFGHFLLTRLLLPNIASAITSLLHVLLCNAGMGGYGGKAPRLTEDGLELVMQSNYFGHFLLTRLLLPNIASAITSLLHVLLCNAGMGGYGGKAPRLTEDGLELVMQSNYFGHFLLTRLLLPNIASAITSLLHVLLCNAGMGGYGGKAPRLTEDCLELVMQSNYFGHFLLTRLLLPNIASAITSLLHVLLCNAGMGGYGGKAPRLTEDGLELVMQSNYFGHFLLTRLLLPNIAKGSRIVNVSSLMHKFTSKLPMENLDLSQSYKGPLPYIYSKLAQILSTRDLAFRLHDRGIAVTALHPGFVNTAIFNRQNTLIGKTLSYIASWFKNPNEGAQTSLYLAVSPAVEGVSGEYFSDCAPLSPSLLALDRHLADRLWTKSCRLTNLPDHL